MTNETKIKALAAYLKIDPSVICVSKYEPCLFLTPSGDKRYLVLTHSESESRVRDEIQDLVWNFSPSFIVDHSTACQSNREAFEKLIRVSQAQRCEANDAILSLIDDFDEFFADAIRVYGVRCFLAQYYVEEIELSDGLFAYRL